jgi:hypothetical protein
MTLSQSARIHDQQQFGAAKEHASFFAIASMHVGLLNRAQQD